MRTSTCSVRTTAKGASVATQLPNRAILNGLLYSDALTELQLKRYCCRRMVLTHVDLIEKLLQYNRALTYFSSKNTCAHVANSSQ